jgi:hypothetical protein
MWYAGCTIYRAVYVFDLDNPVSQHGKDFWDLLRNKADLLPSGNVRALTYLNRWDYKIVVAPPEHSSCCDLSCVFYGFMADTMEEVVLKLNDAI